MVLLHAQHLVKKPLLLSWNVWPMSVMEYHLACEAQTSLLSRVFP